MTESETNSTSRESKTEKKTKKQWRALALLFSAPALVRFAHERSSINVFKRMA